MFYSENATFELKAAFEAKFGRKITEVGIGAVLYPGEILTAPVEISFVQAHMKYIQAKHFTQSYEASFYPPSSSILNTSSSSSSEESSDIDESVESVSIASPEVLLVPEFKSQEWFDRVGRKSTDKALLCEINKVPGGDISRWREWILAPPNTTASSRARLAYIRKWSSDGTRGLSEADGNVADSMLKALNGRVQSGDLSCVVGKATSTEKLDIQRRVTAHLAAPWSVSDINNLNVFSSFLPARRSGDLVDFRIFDSAVPTNFKGNCFVKSSSTFIFRDFKNACQFPNGVQIIPSANMLRVSANKARSTAGLAWLFSKPDGFRLIEEGCCKNLTTYITRKNAGLNTNAFRHHLESIVSPTLSCQDRVILRYWLAHSAATAEAHYMDN